MPGKLIGRGAGHVGESLATALSRMGRRLDVYWLVENPLVFRYYHRLSLRDAPAAARALEAVFPSCRRYLDVGAGTGAFAAELQRRDMNVTACERGLVGRLYARRQGVDARPFDLTREPAAMVDGPFDLAYSFEVAQQLPEPLGHRLVEFLSQQAPLVVFSSAQPGQGGTEPVNLHPKSYWIERFNLSSMTFRPRASRALVERFRAEGVVGHWLIDNVIVLERQT